MKLKFEVIITTNKSDGGKLDVEIRKPTTVPQKWGGLILLTHMGILKGLQDAYKIADGQMVDEQDSDKVGESEGVRRDTDTSTVG